MSEQLRAAAASISPADELKIALDNRAFEIQLFWQRSNYFLVLMSALGIATFSVKNTAFAPVVSGFAALCSYLWFRVNAGSKFWQESWEVEVNRLAKEQGVRAFERPTLEVRGQVHDSLASGWKTENHSWLQTWVAKQVTRKFSVTYHMMLLSLFSVVMWVLVTLALVIEMTFPLLTPHQSSQVLIQVQSARTVTSSTFRRLRLTTPARPPQNHTPAGTEGGRSLPMVRSQRAQDGVA